MKILIDRKWKKDTYTIGRLYVNGVLFCNTLEDKDRGLNQTDSLTSIKSKKVYGETAIPIGTYKVSLDIKSPKYSQINWYKDLCKGYMPRILNVPGWEGILIHPLTDASQTLGCIGVGLNTQVGKLTKSKETFAKLYKQMKAAHDKKEEITIEIK
jgi:hypothetical protein